MARVCVAAVLLALAAGFAVPAFADADDAALMQACPDLAAWAATHPHGAQTAQAEAGQKVADPALRRELARRAAADQSARESMIAGAAGAAAHLMATDANNLAWLKTTVARQGFPALAAVGAEGVANAWLLVQHADRDPGFQSAMLARLQADPHSGVRKADIALLTDRVLRAQGKPQRYGSQFMPAADGSPVLEPTEDIAHVDARRAAMDLMPLALYRCVLHATYAPPAGH